MNRVKTSNARRLAARAIEVAAVLCVFAGCDARKGPALYEVSGKITFHGAPVPRGYIVFAPTAAEDRNARSARAAIIDGAYKTPPELGTVGGPQLVTIVGFDGVPFSEPGRPPNRAGKRLFPPIQVKIDLPRQAATHDFVLPAE